MGFCLSALSQSCQNSSEKILKLVVFKSSVTVGLDKDVHKVFHKSAKTKQTNKQKSLKVANYTIQDTFKFDAHLWGMTSAFLAFKQIYAPNSILQKASIT